MMYRKPWSVASVMAPGPDVGLRIDQAVNQIADLLLNIDDTLDLVVLPEFILRRPDHAPEHDALVADDPLLKPIRLAVARLHAWTVLPVLLREANWLSNAALLFDRYGSLAGIYRKRHVVTLAGEASCEDGVRPGSEVPIFFCDGVKVGIQICWDVMYDDGWDRLARAGADIIVHPTACAQEMRPAMHALRHHVHVLTACRYGQVALFDPLGLAVAKRAEPGILRAEVPFDTAVVHWTPTFAGGELARTRYGSRIECRYSEREATGLLWSCDPTLSIRRILHSLGLRDLPDELQHQAELERLQRIAQFPISGSWRRDIDPVGLSDEVVASGVE